MPEISRFLGIVIYMYYKDHLIELEEDWLLAKERKPLKPIEPLE